MVLRPAPLSRRARLGQHPVLRLPLAEERAGSHAGYLTDRELGQHGGRDRLGPLGALIIIQTSPDHQAPDLGPVGPFGEIHVHREGKLRVHELDHAAGVRQLSFRYVHPAMLRQMSY